MRIINKPNLPYEVIGQIMDKYVNDTYEDTCYYGKIETFDFSYNKKIYHMRVRYLKTFVEWTIEE